MRCVPAKSLAKLKELSEFVNELASVRRDSPVNALDGTLRSVVAKSFP